MFKQRRLNSNSFSILIDSFMSFRKHFNKLNINSPFILKSNNMAYFLPEISNDGNLSGLFIFDKSNEQQRFFYEHTYKLSMGVETQQSLFECYYIGFADVVSNREYNLSKDHEIAEKEFENDLFVSRRYSKNYPNRIVSSKEAKFIVTEINALSEALKNLRPDEKSELIKVFNHLRDFDFGLLQLNNNKVKMILTNVNNIDYELNIAHANETILEDITGENTDKKALFLVNTFDVGIKADDDIEPYYTHSVFYIIEGAPGIDVEFLSNKPESFNDVITGLFIDYINMHGIPTELVINSFLVEEIIGDMATVLGINVKFELINSVSDSYFLSLNETAKHFSSQIIDFPNVQFIEKQYYNVVFDALKEMAKISQMIFSNMKDKTLSVEDVKSLIEDINDDIPGSNIKIETKEVTKEEYNKLKKKDMLLTAFNFEDDNTTDKANNDEQIFDEEDDDFFNVDNDNLNSNIVS